MYKYLLFEEKYFGKDLFILSILFIFVHNSLFVRDVFFAIQFSIYIKKRLKYFIVFR